MPHDFVTPTINNILCYMYSQDTFAFQLRGVSTFALELSWPPQMPWDIPWDIPCGVPSQPMILDDWISSRTMVTASASAADLLHPRLRPLHLQNGPATRVEIPMGIPMGVPMGTPMGIPWVGEFKFDLSGFRMFQGMLARPDAPRLKTYI